LRELYNREDRRRRREKAFKADELYLMEAPARASLRPKPDPLDPVPLTGCFSKKTRCRYIIPAHYRAEYANLVTKFNRWIVSLGDRRNESESLILLRLNRVVEIGPTYEAFLAVLVAHCRYSPTVQIVESCAPKGNPSQFFTLPDGFPVVFRPIEKASELDSNRVTLSAGREDFCLVMAKLALNGGTWYFHPASWTMGPDPLMDMVVNELGLEWIPPRVVRERRVAAAEAIPATLLASSNPFEDGAASAGRPIRIRGGGSAPREGDGPHEPAHADEAAPVDRFDDVPGLAAGPDGDDSGEDILPDAHEDLIDDVRDIMKEAAEVDSEFDILEEGDEPKSIHHWPSDLVARLGAGWATAYGVSWRTQISVPGWFAYGPVRCLGRPGPFGLVGCIW